MCQLMLEDPAQAIGIGILTGHLLFLKSPALCWNVFNPDADVVVAQLVAYPSQFSDPRTTTRSALRRSICHHDPAPRSRAQFSAVDRSGADAPGVWCNWQWCSPNTTNGKHGADGVRLRGRRQPAATLQRCTCSLQSMAAHAADHERRRHLNDAMYAAPPRRMESNSSRARSRLRSTHDGRRPIAADECSSTMQEAVTATVGRSAQQRWTFVVGATTIPITLIALKCPFTPVTSKFYATPDGTMRRATVPPTQTTLSQR